MESTYYIILQNRNYSHELGENDYHLELIPPNRIHQILKDEEFYFQVKMLQFGHTNHFIITNDPQLLNKYIFAINIEEFSALCRKPNYKKNMIRINLDFFGSFAFENDIYKYCQDILDKKIISASMIWEFTTTYPYDDDRDGVTTNDFRGWETNKFLYYQN